MENKNNMEIKYKVIIIKYTGKTEELEDYIIKVKNEKYMFLLNNSTIGNDPKVYKEIKGLASLLLEKEQVDKNKPFTITIKQ